MMVFHSCVSSFFDWDYWERVTYSHIFEVTVESEEEKNTVASFFVVVSLYE
jgi:hypothetical protein